MAIAYHVVFGCYGFWLPNDPRGSWSKHVYSRQLQAFGEATTVHTSDSVAHVPHDHAKRLAAKSALMYPAVRLSMRQVEATARGFAQASSEADTRVYACAIMPDHVHLVIGERGQDMDNLVGRFKSRATKQLQAEEIHPLNGKHTPWARSYWKVYLDDDEDVR